MNGEVLLVLFFVVIDSWGVDSNENIVSGTILSFDAIHQSGIIEIKSSGGHLHLKIYS